MVHRFPDLGVEAAVLADQLAERAAAFREVVGDLADVLDGLAHVAERGVGAVVEARVVQQEAERPGAAVELARDRGDVRRDLIELAPVLLDQVGEVREQPLRIRIEAADELVHVLRDARQLIDDVREAGRRLAFERVAGLRRLRGRRAERERHEALAAEGAEVETGDRVLLHHEAAVDQQRDAHVVPLDLRPAHPAGLDAGQPDVGAAVEALHVPEGRVQLVAAPEQAEPQGQLDGDEEEDDADDEESSDPLFSREHRNLLRLRARRLGGIRG